MYIRLIKLHRVVSYGTLRIFPVDWSLVDWITLLLILFHVVVSQVWIVHIHATYQRLGIVTWMTGWRDRPVVLIMAHHRLVLIVSRLLVRVCGNLGLKDFSFLLLYSSTFDLFNNCEGAENYQSNNHCKVCHCKNILVIPFSIRCIIIRLGVIVRGSIGSGSEEASVKLWYFKLLHILMY